MVLTPPTQPNKLPDLKQRDVRETVTAPKVFVSFLSIPGNVFFAQDPGTAHDEISVLRGTAASGEGGITPDGVDGIFMAAVNLPHGAIVTNVIVNGDAAATAETWTLIRHAVNTLNTQTTMATANIGTADATINNTTIDNQNYTYFISTSSLDDGDTIYDAVITYTTTT